MEKLSPKPQLYKLTRTATFVGTKEALDRMVRDIPDGEHSGTDGLLIHMATVGVRQLVTDIKVPEPAQLPPTPGTTKIGA